MINPLPLSLYIHMPWCIKKCPYCDFNSHVMDLSDIQKQKKIKDQYIETLLQDLEHDCQRYLENDSRPLKSIFIGGGTPSLFEPEQIAMLLEKIKKYRSFAPDIEITMEANPSTFEYQRFYDFSQTGINRLSIGIQSFNPIHLKQLGRIHNHIEAVKAIEIAQQCQFKAINLDLMHGLPEQTINEALNDLKQAIHFNTTHLSWYQLTIEPNTQFYVSTPKLPDEQALWGIEQEGKTLLKDHGFNQYEISAYAKAEINRCQHNLNYWRFGDYLGIGAGAHGKLTLLSQSQDQFQTQNVNIIRTEKIAQPQTYLKLDPVTYIKEHSVLNHDRAFEFFMNRFRLYEDCPKEALFECTGLSEIEVAPMIQKAIDQGFIVSEPDSWRLTKTGTLFLNDLLSLFI